MEITAEPKIYTVTEISKTIKKTLEKSEEFNRIWVQGEIYNLTYHSSGHIYFSLKDDNSVISVTFFKNSNKSLKFKLEEGQSVFANGSISVFEKRGSYQLNVYAVKLEGVGELQKRIEQLKKKLLEEGVFDDLNKKPLPFLPGRMGIVTSPTGAAVQDIIKVALRRFPNLEIVIAPAKVQGDDAPITIARAIEELNKPEYDIDVIIAGRGGGSFEDLMPFNEEIVIRAFFESRVPIISAVGHQVDTPLSDFAADIAAPTPSAAAEIAVPEKRDLTNEIDYYLDRVYQVIINSTRQYRTILDNITEKRIFKNPMEIISQRNLLLSEVQNRIISHVKELISNKRNILLRIPDIKILIKNILENKTHRYNLALNSINQLSPLNVMNRGYSMTFNEKNELIKSVDKVNADDQINIYLSDGLLNCNVNDIKKGAKFGEKNEK